MLSTKIAFSVLVLLAAITATAAAAKDKATSYRRDLLADGINCATKQPDPVSIEMKDSSKPIPKMGHISLHGRSYRPKTAEDGSKLKRKECLKVGEWFPRVQGGSCWRQEIPADILKREDYCPLYLEQTRKECIAKGCEWHPKSVWRCFKTPELIAKEAVKDIVYHGTEGETRFTPFKYKGITKDECEEDKGVWIPLTDWECWLEISISPPAAEGPAAA